jgi:hypothetical protein
VRWLTELVAVSGHLLLAAGEQIAVAADIRRSALPAA